MVSVWAATILVISISTSTPIFYGISNGASTPMFSHISIWTLTISAFSDWTSLSVSVFVLSVSVISIRTPSGSVNSFRTSSPISVISFWTSTSTSFSVISIWTS